MKISVKSEYGLKAMLELALVHGKGTSNIYEIAKKQNIPKRYLEHLLLALKNAGLVDSFRGKDGGYRLAKEPGKMRVGDIVRAIEGGIDILPKNRKGAGGGVVFGVWVSVQNAIEKVLDSMTLEDLVAEKQKGEKNLIYII
ncbi:Rrf2 family transcriptional regulator [Candidatus Saganbacteria bacterium]|nr:Rrf2 family transcriptional regulator [Candidatus Saganbacteria bacterium]